MKPYIFIAFLCFTVYASKNIDTIYPVVNVFTDSSIHKERANNFAKIGNGYYSLSIAPYLMIAQFGFGSGLVGAEWVFTRKYGGGIDLIPEYTISKNSMRFRIGYFEKHLSYYSWAVVPDAVKTNNYNTYRNFVLGIGYLRKKSDIDSDKIISIAIGLDLIARTQLNCLSANCSDFYVSPIVMFSIKSFWIYLQFNKEITQRLWENESFSMSTGVAYSINIGNKFKQ
jgi:hypothetical protein